MDGAEFAPVVPRPSKVVCAGLNYRTHIQEMGRNLPEHLTLFAKFADTLIGAGVPSTPVARLAHHNRRRWPCPCETPFRSVVYRSDERPDPESTASSRRAARNSRSALLSARSNAAR